MRSVQFGAVEGKARTSCPGLDPGPRHANGFSIGLARGGNLVVERDGSGSRIKSGTRTQRFPERAHRSSTSSRPFSRETQSMIFLPDARSSSDR